jgi:hypothetical protein
LPLLPLLPGPKLGSANAGAAAIAPIAEARTVAANFPFMPQNPFLPLPLAELGLSHFYNDRENVSIAVRRRSCRLSDRALGGAD